MIDQPVSQTPSNLPTEDAIDPTPIVAESPPPVPDITQVSTEFLEDTQTRITQELTRRRPLPTEVDGWYVSKKENLGRHLCNVEIKNRMTKETRRFESCYFGENVDVLSWAVDQVRE